MTKDENKIIADDGKVFRRIADGAIYGRAIVLGNSYYIGGLKLDEPHHDTPEDFEEVDDEGDITAEEALHIITGKDE